MAQERDLILTLITSETKSLPGSRVLYPCAPDRELEALDLSSVTMFMDFSKSKQKERLLARLAKKLPRRCLSVSLHAESPRSQSAKAKSQLRVLPRLRRELEKIAIRASELLTSLSKGDIISHQISLEDVCDSPDIKPGTIVNWPSNAKVTVQINSVDSLNLFSPIKTYWLVGLTGSLGITLCEWMIHHGVRQVVLSSRAPKVENRCKEEMKSLGATIWIRSWYYLNSISKISNLC